MLIAKDETQQQIMFEISLNTRHALEWTCVHVHDTRGHAISGGRTKKLILTRFLSVAYMASDDMSEGSSYEGSVADMVALIPMCSTATTLRLLCARLCPPPTHTPLSHSWLESHCRSLERRYLTRCASRMHVWSRDLNGASSCRQPHHHHQQRKSVTPPSTDEYHSRSCRVHKEPAVHNADSAPCSTLLFLG